MSVLNPKILSIDGVARRVYLKQGVSDFYPIEDIYHEYRNRRRLDTDGLRRYNPLLRAEGNVPKGGGAFTPRYVVLLEGTKIVPFDESLQINQLGDMITDNPDVDATLYDISSLTTAKTIFISPSEAEVIQLNSQDIQYSSYSNGVWVDQTNGIPGTTFPIGTPRQPVNNLVDAQAIADANGFKDIHTLTHLTIGPDSVHLDMKFWGRSPKTTNIFIDEAANVFNCEYQNALVSGTLDGSSFITNCAVKNLVYLSGHLENCVIREGTIVLRGVGIAVMDGCSGIHALDPGQSYPVIDFNGSGSVLAMKGFNGEVKLINKTGSDPASIDMNSGTIIIDDTVTGGPIKMRGIGAWVNRDTYTGGATIDDQLIRAEDITYIRQNLGTTVWSQEEKDNVLAYSKKSSDNAEQTNLKL